MPFITQGKANIKYFLIITIFAAIGGLITPIPSEATSRSRAHDARIMGDTAQMRALAEMIYSAEGSYVNFSCENGGNYNEEMKSLCDDIEDRSGSKPIIHQSKDDYCVYSKLVNTQGAYFCINYPGSSIQTYIDPSGEDYCNDKTFLCPKETGNPPLSVSIEKIYVGVVMPGLVIGGAILALFISFLAYFKRKREDLIKKKRWLSLVWNGTIAPILFIILAIYIIFIIIIFSTLFKNLSTFKYNILSYVAVGGALILYGLSAGFAIGSLFQRRSLRNLVDNILLLIILLFFGFVLLVSLG